MTPRIEVRLPKPHPGQQRMIQEARRHNVAAMGRRYGKTLVGVRLVSRKALAGRMPCAWFAPTYRLLDEAWREIKRRLAPAATATREQDKRIELMGGGSIDFWTLEDPSAGRGRKYARIVVDEAAHARNLRQALEEAILPTLTDYRGDAWYLSTPAGHNYFHELWSRSESRDDWQSWQLPTSANPYIDPAEVEAMRALLPERVFRQEYLAEFIQDGAGVFRGVDRAPETPWRDEAAPGRSHVIGADWGRHNDFTVFAVLDDLGDLVHLERFTEIGYELQVGRLKALWERFGRCPILAESNSMGGPLIERLQRERVNVRAFTTTSASKAEAIEALALAIENGQLALPRDPRVEVLRHELIAFDQERLPSGAIRYGAPPGGHDDCVMSLAIAWHGVHLTRPTPVMLKVPSL